MTTLTILAVIETSNIIYTDGDLTGPVVTAHTDLAAARAHFVEKYLDEDDKFDEVDHGHKVTLSRPGHEGFPTIIGSITEIDW